MKKTLLAGMAAGLVGLPMLTTPAQAEVTANVGWVSEYLFRGIPQKTSSASLGLDVESNGFYLGTWAADVGDGSEVDLYGGYLWEQGDLTLGVGGTVYLYTGDFDDTYQEINFYAGYGPLSAEFSIGRWDAFDDPKEDYTFFSLTAEHAGFYATYGRFGRDFEGDYLEAGYGFEIAGVDVNIAWVWSSKKLLGTPKDDDTIFIGFTKTFSLMD